MIMTQGGRQLAETAPQTNGQGPGDGVTGTFWPSGGSGGSLPPVSRAMGAWRLAAQAQ